MIKKYYKILHGSEKFNNNSMVKKNTKFFITEFISSAIENIYSELSIDNQWKIMLGHYQISNKEVIQKYIKSLTYENFLDTIYWKLISAIKKEQANNNCQLCNSDKKLTTHHRNYKIKGLEIDNMNELIVLCDKCHNKFHNKE